MSGACPGCGSADSRTVLTLKEASGKDNGLVRCRRCSLVRAGRMPSASDLAAYYERYSYDGELAWAVPHATTVSLDRLARQLAAYYELGRLLDVGCGAGAVLTVMASHGWTVEGSDLSEVAVARLRAAGQEVHHGSLEQLSLGAGRFDVILMSELIEHLPDPRPTLAAAHRLLRPGGALFLTTPNIGSLTFRFLGARWRVVAPREHLLYFDPGALRSLLTRSGFVVKWLTTEGLNPYEILNGLRRVRTAPEAVGLAGPTERLRTKLVQSRRLAVAKKIVNRILGLTSLGDTLKALAERR